jgi:hypothetical protein
VCTFVVYAEDIAKRTHAKSDISGLWGGKLAGIREKNKTFTRLL